MLTRRKSERAMKVMVGDAELVGDGANILNSPVIDARFYRPDSLLNQKLRFDAVLHPPRMPISNLSTLKFRSRF
jgi:hypothetical protein